MTKWGTRILLFPLAAALLLAVLFIWHRGRTPQAEEPSVSGTPAPAAPKAGPAAPTPDAAAAFRVAADGMVDIPARFQLPGVSRARSGASLKEWMGQYPPDQQQKLLDFNKRHFGVYMVNAPEQVAWMAQNGYPLPEDVIAAESLSVDDLRELMKHGNDKAGFLLHERNLATVKEKVDAYLANGKTQADFWLTDPDAPRLTADNLLTNSLVDKSSSPYKGYVQALDSVLMSEQEGIDSAIIAGLAWAQHLGDFRASQLASEYAADNAQRMAMLGIAARVSTNGSRDMAEMRVNGCQRVGTPPGMFIPGAFAPVD